MSVRKIAHGMFLLFGLAGCASTFHSRSIERMPSSQAELDSSLWPKRTANLPNCISENQTIRMVEYTYRHWHSDKLNQDYSLRAYVFYPTDFKKGETRPVIAMFHGGGWIGGSPTYYFPMARYFASRGAISVTFQYRLQEVFGSEPEESASDATYAIRWLRKHSSDLGVNSAEITALGDSAGGTLALDTALVSSVLDGNTNDSSIPKNIIVFYPVVDSKSLAPIEGTAISLIHPAISPDLLLKKQHLMPPMLILHGSSDDHPWASFEKSEQFCEQVNRLDTRNTCSFQSYEGRKHGFLNTPSDYDSALNAVDQFLSKEGMITQLANTDEVIRNADPTCREILKSYDSIRTQWGYGSPGSSRWTN
jgi:acetyl esterase